MISQEILSSLTTMPAFICNSGNMALKLIEQLAYTAEMWDLIDTSHPGEKSVMLAQILNGSAAKRLTTPP